MMNEKRFWEIVEEINWPVICKEHRGYEKAKKQLLNTLTLEEVTKLRDIAQDFKNAIYEPLFCKVTGVGDDGYGDFLCHIIGMGKKEYKKCVKDNDYAVETYNDNYVENFFYCFPYEEDYEKKSETYDGFFKWGDRIYRSFEKICSNEKVINAFDLEISKKIFYLRVTFEKFAIEKDYQFILKEKEKILQELNGVMEYLEKNKRTLPHILFMTNEEIFESDENNVESKKTFVIHSAAEELYKDYGMDVLRNEWTIRNFLNDVDEIKG